MASQLNQSEIVTPLSGEAGSTPANWSGVLAMTLCVFALIASEFMPVSLLTQIAKDLSVSEGLAGQGITISGIFAVLTSLTISQIAGRMNRRTLLLILTVLMAVSALTVGLATHYATYMVGRALIGIVVGGFWSMSVAIAVRLVPVSQVPRALAVFNGGNALATVIAAPLGSYLASVTSWRGAFLSIVPIAVVAFIWQWISLPSMKAKRPAGTFKVLSLLLNPKVAFGMLGAGIFFMGQFSLFTYVRPFLETVTRVSPDRLSLILLVMGAAGFFGTSVIGYFLRRRFYGTLIAIPSLMSLLALALIPAGESVLAVTILLGLWGMLATAAPVGWWSWVAHATEGETEAGGGLLVAVVQLFIALGSTVGGMLFDTSGYSSTFAVSAAVLLLAALMAGVTARKARH
ncbi:MFS transporter [Enterobacteriaceae bacterium H4N4]|uniref:MFS transporter n=1 Tax=Silvania confinis TaxID=2926470 RepID=A0A9J6QD72_9ENTR|nr:MFS transporter [Silvania confinis]MCU6668195.1 MFS transporter [Silvania confinis]